MWTADENKADFPAESRRFWGFQLYQNRCFHFLKENTNGKHLHKLYTHVRLLFVDMILKSFVARLVDRSVMRVGGIGFHGGQVANTN